MMVRPETIKMLIRLHLDLKRWIEAQAARNVSPQGREIIRILRTRTETEQRGGGLMTRALPFTEASVARAIKGVWRAGLFVVGVRPDGTLIVADKPIDVTSLVPAEARTSPTAETRRMGDYFHGGSSETEGT